MFKTPQSVVVRNTPVASGEALNKDIGVYGQDTWTLKRLTLSAGIRYEQLNAGVSEMDAAAGRFVPARHASQKNGQPDWTDWAPRVQAIYDVFGNSKTAVKYSINKYAASQTTTIASGFNPLASTTARVNWTDLNGDDIAQGARTWSADGKSYTDCVYLTPGCEINLAGQLSPTFGIVSDSGSYAGFPRQYSLEQGLEVQHELITRLSVSGSWYRGDFRNLTTTINRAITPADYTATQIFNPVTGAPVTIYNQSAASLTRAADNFTFVDKDRKSIFNSYSAEFRFRPGRSVNVFGGLSWERSRDTAYGTASATNNCTVGRLQNPNLAIYCDEFNLADGNKVPYAVNVRLNGSYQLPWYGILVAANLQSNDGGGLGAELHRDAYHEIPGRFGQLPRRQPAGAGLRRARARRVGWCCRRSVRRARRFRCGPTRSCRGERLNQLDLKFSKTFKVGRATISPNLEAFNINNTDKVITYGSTSYAISTGTYLKPNSITQGRILGVGASVRW